MNEDFSEILESCNEILPNENLRVTRVGSKMFLIMEVNLINDNPSLVEERPIASGFTKDELLESCHSYKSLIDMRSEDFIEALKQDIDKTIY